jgi:hypothetical protein
MSASRAIAWGLAALATSLLSVASAVERHDFITNYQRPGTRDYLVYYDELRHERFLESVADELNRVLDLPATVTLRTAECGHSTTSWAIDSHTVTVCYEYLDALLVIAGENGVASERSEQMFSGGVTFALFSEIGRALTALYSLPVPQGVDRAADEFAAITLAAAEQSGDPSAAAALEFFDLALKDPDAGLEFLQLHAFDRARLEDVACILYGNSPATHAQARALIAPERIARCPEEVLAVAHQWDLWLKDHARGGPMPAAPAMSLPPQSRS